MRAALLAIGLVAHPAFATVIVDGGSELTVTTNTASDFIVRDGSRLRLADHAVITSSNELEHGTISLSGTSSSERAVLQVSDHAQIADGPIYVERYGDVYLRDDAYVAGGIRSPTGGGTTEQTASHRVYMQDRAFVAGSVRIDGFLKLEDEAIVAGQVISPDWGIRLEMLGGEIRGRVLGASLNYHYVDVHGGSLLGGVESFASLFRVNMTDGLISSFNMRGQLDANISGGQILNGMLINPASSWLQTNHIVFSGGIIDTLADRWLIDLSPGFDSWGHSLSTLDLWGGQFGYGHAGSGIRLDYFSDLNVYGYGLNYLDGRLWGTLSDGNAIDVGLTFGSSWTGALRLHEISVPEPGTWGLMLLGVVACGLAGHGRRKAQVAPQV